MSLPPGGGVTASVVAAAANEKNVAQVMKWFVCMGSFSSFFILNS
jgi:hypothetical protein